MQIDPPPPLDVVRAEVETLLREGRVELYEFQYCDVDELVDAFVQGRDKELPADEPAALSLEEALAAIADETSWTPGGRGDNPLSLRITKSGYEEYLRSYPLEMFDSAAVVAVFEEATGVRLEQEHYPELDRYLDRLRLTNPAIRLPQVENYRSPEAPNDRLGGHFALRFYLEGDWHDEGVDDEGLERLLPERGPGGYQVSASARRANVELMFWGDTSEITPEAEATWALLTACLRRL